MCQMRGFGNGGTYTVSTCTPGAPFSYWGYNSFNDKCEGGFGQPHLNEALRERLSKLKCKLEECRRELASEETPILSLASGEAKGS